MEEGAAAVISPPDRGIECWSITGLLKFADVLPDAENGARFRLVLINQWRSLMHQKYPSSTPG